MSEDIRDRLARMIWKTMTKGTDEQWSAMIKLSNTEQGREPVHRAFAAADKAINAIRFGVNP